TRFSRDWSSDVCSSDLGEIWDLTLSHLWLTLLPTLIGLILSIPLGYLAYTYRRSYTFIVGGTSLFYTIPSLALFILLPKVMGTKIGRASCRERVQVTDG